jgi:hypothetical protein
MDDDFKWLIGAAITLSLFLGRAFLTAIRSLSASIKSGDDQLNDLV